jgi:hypothetical protein
MQLLRHCGIVALALLGCILSFALPVAMASGEPIPAMSSEQAFLIAGIVGMVAHYIKKLATGDVTGSLADYFLRDYPGRSAGAIFGYGMAAATVLATGAIGSMDLWVAIGSGVTTGWTCDSAFNKGT